MGPVVNMTVKETPVVIKAEPNLDKRNLQHGDRPARDDYLDVIVISSDSESGHSQRCHDPGLTRSDPDPSSSDLTLIDGVMIVSTQPLWMMDILGGIFGVDWPRSGSEHCEQCSNPNLNRLFRVRLD